MTANETRPVLHPTDAATDTVTGAGPLGSHAIGGTRTGHAHSTEGAHGTGAARTSAAAAFALALGVAALLMVLTLVLSPVGLVVGIVGIVLGVLGIMAARRAGVTGRNVAITGLVLSVVAVLLAAATAIGITAFWNDQGAVDQLQQQVQQVRDGLPTQVDIPRPADVMGQ